MTVSINVDAQQMGAAQKILEQMGRQANPIIARVLNRAITGVRTDITKNVRSVYNVKAQKVRRSISLDRASKQKLFARADIRSERISLLHFGARPSSASARAPRGGVSVHVKAARQRIPGTFIPSLPGGGTGVFWRVPGRHTTKRLTGGRSPSKHTQAIQKLTGPSVPQMAENNNVLQGVQQGAVDRVQKNLNHEIDRYLLRKGLR